MNRTKDRIELENRIMAFGLATLKMLREVPAGVELRYIRKRLTQSATSTGVLYRLANLTKSRVEHAAGIAAARREMAESEYWLGLIKELKADLPYIAQLHRESMELLGLFAKLQLAAERRKGQ